MSTTRTGRPQPRVLVAGAGAAGLAAAISVHEAGARVTLLEKGGPDAVGGNARYSGGLFLFSHAGERDVAELVELGGRAVDIAPYPVERYRQALADMSDGRAQPDLVDALAEESLDTMRWLHRQGAGFELVSGAYGSYERDGVLVVPPGPALESRERGAGLVADLLAEVSRRGIRVEHRTPLRDLRLEDGRVTGAVVGPDGALLAADAVVLAAGGFQASAELRRRHLGPGWEHAMVRGTEHDAGDVLEAAVARGAGTAGDWSECHAISVDADGREPVGGGGSTPARLSRGFRYGIVVNALGRRFFDEGEDAWTNVYSKMGRAILAQPGGVAYHVFDDRVRGPLDEALPDAQPIEGASLGELAAAAGISAAGLIATVRAYNAAIVEGTPLDHDVLDGRRTAEIDPPKSNWAERIDRPPYRLYRGVCGITFTHGGLHVDAHARVLDTHRRPIAGLLAAGELAGGFFFGNYPGGSSLMRSAVFGRRAGRTAVGDLGGR